jgi:hypothetical protein
MPVRDAVLMISLSTLVKAEGVYLIKPDGVAKVVKGYVNVFAVGPDGCKVALNINPNERIGARNAVVNVCKRGK